jgi:hypothetical protein
LFHLHDARGSLPHATVISRHFAIVHLHQVLQRCWRTCGSCHFSTILAPVTGHSEHILVSFIFSPSMPSCRMPSVPSLRCIIAFIACPTHPLGRSGNFPSRSQREAHSLDIYIGLFSHFLRFDQPAFNLERMLLCRAAALECRPYDDCITVRCSIPLPAPSYCSGDSCSTRVFVDLCV